MSTTIRRIIVLCICQKFNLFKREEHLFFLCRRDNCGSIDFEHRGLRYHIWEFADDVEPVGVETNLRYAGRDEEIEGDYDTILAEHLKKEF